MIDKPTVFILGAGASVPYGYPTGEGLREDICKNFLDRIVGLVKEVYSSQPDVALTTAKETQRFTSAFLNSSTPSIDLFLSRNISFADIGKEAIVTSILTAEENGAFRENMRAGLQAQDWYSYIYHKMTEDMIDPESYKNFYQNEVTFITFNYDRSLEHFLFESLRNSFTSASLAEIQAQFNLIKIFHVYGAVDKLPWQGGLTAYGEKPSLRNLTPLKSNIKIIHERTISENDLNLMKEKIKEASRIYFLGFSYAKENLNMLRIPAIFNVTQQVYGTAFNLTEKETSEIKARLSPYFHTDGPQFDPKIMRTDCRSLLRDWL